MTRIAVLISPNLRTEPELSASGAHPGAGRSPDPEALPAVLPEEGEQPPRSRPGPPARPPGTRPGTPSPALQRGVCILTPQPGTPETALPAAGSRPPPVPSAAPRTREQTGLHAGTRDARPARAGSGPGQAWRRRRQRGPRDAPSRPLSRTPAPLPHAGLRASLLLGHLWLARADPEAPGTASRSTPPTQRPPALALRLSPGLPGSQMSCPGLPQRQWLDPTAASARPPSSVPGLSGAMAARFHRTLRQGEMTG